MSALSGILVRGKSTLIQHFNGLIRPTSGKIYLDGTDIWADKTNIRQVRFQVGLVFQYPEYQIFEDTVYKDIAFGPRNMGLSEAEIKERVEETAALVGLTQAQLNQSPFDLSGGQKRRVAIAGVMALRPKVLILDEPTAARRPERQRRYSSRDSPLSQGNRKNGSAGFSQHGRYGKLCRKNSGDELPERCSVMTRLRTCSGRQKPCRKSGWQCRRLPEFVCSCESRAFR